MADDKIQHGIDDNTDGDAAKGAALGGVGGAAVGAAAGAMAGPVGMAVGALIGGIAGAAGSGAAVAVVDSMDNDDTVSGVGSGTTHEMGHSDDDRLEATHNINSTTPVTDTPAAVTLGGDTDMATNRQPIHTDTDNDLNVNTTNLNQTTGTHQDLNSTQAIPVVEEELQVGKREVETGGVRVTSNVTETPVQEQVTLREEHVHVDRNPVNRPATDADFQAAQTAGTIEVTETAEQAVVAKQARVVEEVTIGKEATERTETISDTVRRTDVNVEQLNFNDFHNDFQTDYQSNYANRGHSFDQVAPHYRHGFDLAQHPQHANSDWSTAETHAQSSWSQNNPNHNWDDYKGAVQYGWNRARNAR